MRAQHFIHTEPVLRVTLIHALTLMGKYTEHWNDYKRSTVRGLLYLLALFVVGLPLTALIAVGIQHFTGSYPVYLHIGLLLIWLMAFCVLVVRSSRVVCPRCGTRYSRGRWLSNCPQCDLRMRQDEP